MGHKIKIKYWARENSKVGTHSFFAQTMPNGTLGFDQACREASENTTVEEDTIRSAVKLYMKVVKKNLLKGFKVDLGDDFLTIEPMLKASVFQSTPLHEGRLSSCILLIYSHIYIAFRESHLLKEFTC